MRALIVTKIFPNSIEPHSSPFNRHQFAALSRIADVQVFATIPWFPGARGFRRWSRAGRLLGVPDCERIDGITVWHPRVAYLPKVGNAVSGPLYVASLAARAVPLRGQVDVVLGSWAYPDGYAAVMLADLLGVPAVVKLHGSDINVLGTKAAARWGISRALSGAGRVVAVSRPLAERAIALGAARDRVDIVPNGVDADQFHPRDRLEARSGLGLPPDKKLVLYVGRVEEQKGAFDLVRALAWSGAELRNTELVMVGDGAGLDACRRLAGRLHVPVHFVGTRPHDEIPQWLAASDLLALPSWNEGMPNAVLEALASGRRVVATRVGGIPDLVTSELGTLVPPGKPGPLAMAIERELGMDYDPERVAQAAHVPSWQKSAEMLKASLLAALESRARGRAA